MGIQDKINTFGALCGARAFEHLFVSRQKHLPQRPVKINARNRGPDARNFGKFHIPLGMFF